MMKGLLVGVGLLVAVAGVIFTLQGVGDIGQKQQKEEKKIKEKVKYSK